MTDLTTDRLDQIRAREQAATPGPWDVYEGNGFLDVAADLEDTGTGYRCRRQIVQFWNEPMDNDPAHEDWDEADDQKQMRADAVFIGNARSDIAYLLDLITKLTAGPSGT